MTSLAEPPSSPESGARVRSWLPALLISIFISLLIVLPFFWLGNASGHDFQFHAQSWLDVSGQWKEGIVYPRWAEWADYGYGEPRFIFYPPNSWVLGAALGSVLPWRVVPGVLVFLVQTLAGMSAFSLARRFLPQRTVLFCVACYAANPYALLNVYLRSDLAELLADALFPLLFLAALDLCERLAPPKGNQRHSRLHGVAVFAIVFALIWLSNAPAAVIASYSCALLFAFAAFTARSWQPAIRGAAGIALGLGLAGFYLLPAVYEQRWVNIAQALSTGLLPAENFLYTEINNPEHTFFNFIASTIAVLLIALTGLAAIQARRAKVTQQRTLDSRLWTLFLLLAGTSTFLMLRMSSVVWVLLPKLRFVQFPWRWMSALAVPFAVFLGDAMGRKRWGWSWALAGFACIAATGAVLVQRAWWDTQDIPVLAEAIAAGSGYDGTDEYDPIGDDHTNIPTKSPPVRVMDTDTMQGPVAKPVVRVVRWSPEEKEVEVSTQLPFYLGLRLLNYPAWRLEINGVRAPTVGGDDYNQMIVHVPPGESRVRVSLARTWDRTVGGTLSFASLLAVVGLLFRRRSSDTHSLSPS